MIMSDREVKRALAEKKLMIDPYFEEFQGPNCYHCHLGTRFLIPKKGKGAVDPLDSKTLKDLFKEVKTKKPIILKPGEFILAETFEYLGVEKGLVIRLLNSSSLARLGISQAALGMINSGCGISKPIRLTLELTNNLPRPVKLVPTTVSKDGKISWGTEVLKIAPEKMSETPEIRYDEWKDGVYSGDQKVTASKMVGRFSSANGKTLPWNSVAWGDAK